MLYFPFSNGRLLGNFKVLALGITPDGIISNNIYDPDSAFKVNFTLQGQVGDGTVANNTQIFMQVAYSNNPTGNCAANRTQRTCSLRPATLRYPVTIQNGTLTLGDLTTNATTVAFSPPGNGTDGGGDYTIWTLGGLYNAANNLFASNATYDWQGAVGKQVYLPDTLSNQFLQITSGPDKPYNSTNENSDPGILYNGLAIPKPCNSSWTDPTDHILSTLNQIAFRISLQAATYPFRNTNAPPAPQAIPMVETTNINVFHSEHKYMIAMIVLTVFFMGLILPTFGGWWELGRRVTLDPVEVAKAFDAPMFRGPGSNAPLWQLVQDYGDRSVKYGEAEAYSDGQAKRQLKFGNPHEVMRPTAGTVYE
jgi:hypothetical protein